MKLIKNREDFEGVFPYDVEYIKLHHYPARYPCVVDIVKGCGGIAGDLCEITYVYIPVEVKCVESFLAGCVGEDSEQGEVCVSLRSNKERLLL